MICFERYLVVVNVQIFELLMLKKYPRALIALHDFKKAAT
ncbi:hypothetical protein RG47T_2859 [Mucilaginibacter polytrichastri]|uniref:Uncharacterized protein n=1 Tax=Mucilaginibacter polytrichastri TaxID=1302689 RepID=A0A1Q6A070_9SPHI|nr:hypothetical protein RG47T_2859 [Mucilaginibacter polytrichastri]